MTTMMMNILYLYQGHAQPEEQSAEDEIATKLDLAKAYVELGDKDSAKTFWMK